MTPDDGFIIATPIKLPNRTITGSYNVGVTYDEGSTFGSTSIGYNSKPFNTPFLSQIQIEGLTLFITILTTLAVIAFNIPFILRFMLGLWHRIRDGFFIRQVKKEILRIQSALQKERPDSIIYGKVWNSKQQDDSQKRKIFYKYNDYKKISDFYSELENRNSYFLNDDLNSDTLSVYNNLCSDIATNVLLHIHWKEYESDLTKARIIWLAIFMAVLPILFFTLDFFF